MKQTHAITETTAEAPHPAMLPRKCQYVKGSYSCKLLETLDIFLRSKVQNWVQLPKKVNNSVLRF